MTLGKIVLKSQCPFAILKIPLKNACLLHYILHYILISEEIVNDIFWPYILVNKWKNDFSVNRVVSLLQRHSSHFTFWQPVKIIQCPSAERDCKSRKVVAEEYRRKRLHVSWTCFSYVSSILGKIFVILFRKPVVCCTKFYWNYES